MATTGLGPGPDVEPRLRVSDLGREREGEGERGVPPDLATSTAPQSRSCKRAVTVRGHGVPHPVQELVTAIIARVRTGRRRVHRVAGDGCTLGDEPELLGH